jgi:hypothetical protein
MPANFLKMDAIAARRSDYPYKAQAPDRTTIESPTDLKIAADGWQDAACLAGGDEYAALMLHCYAAAMLSDQQITGRVLRQVTPSDQPITRRALNLPGISTIINTLDIERYDAAIAVARHCVLMGWPLHQIIVLLTYLAVKVPCWPGVGDRVGIAEAAVMKFAS